MAFANVFEETTSRINERNISEVCYQQAVIRRTTSRLVEAVRLLEIAAYDLAKTDDANCTSTILLHSSAIEQIVRGLNSKLE